MKEAAWTEPARMSSVGLELHAVHSNCLTSGPSQPCMACARDCRDNASTGAMQGPLMPQAFLV